MAGSGCMLIYGMWQDTKKKQITHDSCSISKLLSTEVSLSVLDKEGCIPPDVVVVP